MTSSDFPELGENLWDLSIQLIFVIHNSLRIQLCLAFY